MAQDIITHLTDFSTAFTRMREALALDEQFAEELLGGTELWTTLLETKLTGATGPACLSVAVAGGTNTGKSTLFNVLLNEEVSAVRNTAAATCRPLAAAASDHLSACLDGSLLPGFRPVKLQRVEAILERDTHPETVYVAESDGLSPNIVLLDTPDVDSIDLANWSIADRLRSASDIIVAVLTAEKYQDDRVIGFFREAQILGRVVLPVMNKANPAGDYEVARSQLEEFCRAAHLDTPLRFVMPHDFDLAQDFSGASIQQLDSEQTLGEYIASLDVAEVKRKVLERTIDRFLELAGDFIETCDERTKELRHVADEFNRLADRTARDYKPAPGRAVGGLFHQFVQSKRTAVDRAIGSASRGIANGLSAASRAVRRAIVSSATLEGGEEEQTEDRLRETHRRRVHELTNELARDYYDRARSLGKPVSRLVLEPLDSLPLNDVEDSIAQRAISADGVSEDFRRHAEKILEAWWQDNRGKRMAIEALDRVLLLAPAGIAGVLSVQTAGIGVPEAMVVAGPLAEQFAARVLEHQFGDSMFDFISPWQAEQQAALESALHDELAAPVLAGVTGILVVLEGEHMEALKRSLDACRQASTKS